MKALSFVFLTLTVFVPAFAFASTDSGDPTSKGTLSVEECIQIQTTYAVELEHNCADVDLSTKILQVREQLLYIQTHLLPFLAADKRMHTIVETFNENMQGVIHQMTVEHLTVDGAATAHSVNELPL